MTLKPFKARQPDPPPEPSPPEPTPPIERDKFIKTLLAKPFISDVKLCDFPEIVGNDIVAIEEITFIDGSTLSFEVFYPLGNELVSVEHEPSPIDRELFEHISRVSYMGNHLWRAYNSGKIDGSIESLFDVANGKIHIPYISTPKRRSILKKALCKFVDEQD